MEPGPTLNNGRYNLVEKLGTGGMSVVWRAEDTIKRTEIAIKVLKVAQIWMTLYNYAWFVAFALSFAVYAALSWGERERAVAAPAAAE